MMPYIVATILSSLLVYLDYKMPVKVGGKRVFSIISILILCVVAAARDITVGTDTSVYGENLFMWIHNHDWSQMIIMNQKPDTNIEIGYMVIIFLLSRITDNVFWDYFLKEFICVYFVYKAMDDNGVKKYKWIGIFLFNVLFYSFSLNLMRQSMAIAIVLYGFKYVREKRIWRYILVVFIAFLIHRTALISLCIYPLYALCVGDVKRNVLTIYNKYKSILRIAVIAISCTVVIFARQWIGVLPVLRPSYSIYVQNINSYNPSIMMIILMLGAVAPLLLLKVWKNKNEPKFKFYTMILVMCAILWQLQGISTEVYRIALYLWILVLLIIPELMEVISSSKNKLFFGGYYVFWGSIYYWYVFVYLQTNETYPYTSTLLGIG